ncbi:MAG TPA: GNAT family N-acetyltransferase/peptidase C39 family protein [Rhodothermales bacterium]|nr:GNAT family N-acetyltransferase/peptidase C39 family protein [Rhodothermales bacterium]
MVRPARPSDLDRLVALEEQSFATDRISRSSYRHLLKSGTAVVLVEEEEGVVRGSAVLLFRQGLAAARLYSIATAPEYRGKGIGRTLVDACLEKVVEEGCLFMRLEVREDNREAISLYESRGFKPVGRIHDYYEDGADALRYEIAAVQRHKPPHSLDIPFYAQTLDFTCGAACLMMGLKHFQPDLKLTRTLELDLWREATTIFMTSGIGGCSAEGIAIAATERGLHAMVVTNDRGVPFIDTVRSQDKKEVIEIVHRSFKRRLKETGNPIVYRRFTRRDIVSAIDLNIVPVLLVSGYRLYGEKLPHWVVVTGYDEHFVYIHDPWVPEAPEEFRGSHMPIHESDLTRMNRFGKRGVRTMVLLSDRPFSAPEVRVGLHRILSRKDPARLGVSANGR